jgi:hypothetical protein
MYTTTAIGFIDLSASKLKLTALYIFLAAICSLKAQQYVEITGVLNITTYENANTNGKALFPVEFSCVVGTNIWQMTNNCVQDSTEKFCYDGTNVYEILHQTRPSLPERVAAIEKSGFSAGHWDSNLFGIYIRESSRGGLGGFSYMQAGISWLAFCSGNYLKGENRIIPLPTAYLQYYYDGFAYSDKTEVFADELGLPRTVDLFTSKALAKLSLTNNCLRVKRRLDADINYESPYKDGILAFHYGVDASTNFQGWNLPLQFEFYQNDLDMGKRSLSGTGLVTSIRSVEKLEGIFSAKVKQTVVDWRFHSDVKPVEAIIYPWTNSFLPSTSDPELVTIFKEKEARTASYRPNVHYHAGGLFPRAR